MFRLMLCLLLLAAPLHAEEVAGRVFAVLDGDTVLFRPDTVWNGRAFFKLRLADIDAPESTQPGGEDATRTLTRLALDHAATADIRTLDRYDRPVGRLRVGKVDVATELVRDGHAWASRIHTDPALLALEREARAARRGLWIHGHALPPWRWRASHRDPVQKHISE